jgi:hypothetical protein
MTMFYNYLVKEGLDLPPDYYLRQSLDMDAPFLNKRYPADTIYNNVKILRQGLLMAETMGHVDHYNLIKSKL